MSCVYYSGARCGGYVGATSTVGYQFLFYTPWLVALVFGLEEESSTIISSVVSMRRDVGVVQIAVCPAIIW